MPILVIRSPDGTEQEQEVAESISVGRAEGNDLLLSEGGVSRQHARFFVEGSQVVVEDAGSANGTWVDGERIEGPTPLSLKNQVIIGDYEISLKVDRKVRAPASKGSGRPSSKPTAPAVPRPGNGVARGTKLMPVLKGSPAGGLARRPKPAGNAAGPLLRGLTGAVTGKSFPIAGVMVIGRVPGVDIQLDDDSVSRRHAELEVHGREVVLRDLGSANGTTLNGVPLAEDTPLTDGDIVQFGVVEVMFEGGAPKARALARRAGAALGPSLAPQRHESAVDPRRKRLLIVGGIVVGLLFVMVALKVVLAGPTPVADPPQGVGKTPPQKKDPAQQLEEYLTECRTYSSADLGEPDWARADDACQKALELEPIHAEANQLLKRIQLERACQEHLRKADQLVQSNRLEDSLDQFAKVTKSCPTYFVKTLALAKEPVEEVKKRAGTECRTYASALKWEMALKRCEVYARLACQQEKPEQLEKDPLYLNFVKARQKLKPPTEPSWQCPDFPVFQPPPPPPDPARQAKDELLKRYSDPELGRALVFYFDGRLNEAPVPLQKILENVHKSAEHETAKALLLDLNNIINNFQNGATELTKNKPEHAELLFRDALELDEKLVLGDKRALPKAQRKVELEKRVSFVRKSIVESMASNCYQRGKDLADRKDYRAACKSWKLGFDFSRSNSDILKAIQFCSGKAGAALGSAHTCESLKMVLDFAVDGDGYRDRVEQEMEKLGCD